MILVVDYLRTLLWRSHTLKLVRKVLGSADNVTQNGNRLCCTVKQTKLTFLVTNSHYMWPYKISWAVTRQQSWRETTQWRCEKRWDVMKWLMVTWHRLLNKNNKKSSSTDVMKWWRWKKVKWPGVRSAGKGRNRSTRYETRINETQQDEWKDI